jgi:uncharacterized protein (UPF0248 family)
LSEHFVEIGHFRRNFDKVFRQSSTTKLGTRLLGQALATMTPIQELLNRIRWDAEFARGNFELGYFDRVESRVVVVSFREIEFPPNEPRVFRLLDAEGRVHQVPFHRVREVYKDGQRIWRRPTEAQ